MIVTVTLNAALDLTYTLAGPLRPHTNTRVAEVAERAGGKGLNTARVLHALGEKVLATGFLGGHNGRRIAEEIPRGLRHRFVSVDGESRRAVVVADGGGVTGLWEPGPKIAESRWRELLDRFTGLMAVSTVAVLAGSLPRGLPDDAYAQLVDIARRRGVYTVLDCDGPALRAALPCRPDVVKPNADELAEAADGADTGTREGAHAAAERLRRAGAESVVASLGAAGLLAVTPEGVFAARPPESLSGNPTGAGDACVAALARGAFHGNGWRVRVGEAVALSAAAVKAEVAGHVELRDYLAYRHIVEVEEL